MSPTQQERRIQALYDDSNVSRRNLCERVVHLEADMEDVQAENAKLRELVQDFDKCLTEAVRLAYIQGHATIYDGTSLDSLHPRMRELGVEMKG